MFKNIIIKYFKKWMLRTSNEYLNKHFWDNGCDEKGINNKLSLC